MTGTATGLVAAALAHAGLPSHVLDPHFDGSDEPGSALVAVPVVGGRLDIPEGRWLQVFSSVVWEGPAQADAPGEMPALLLQRDGTVVSTAGRTLVREGVAELKLSVAAGGVDDRRTPDGTRVRLEPPFLRVEGPERDVFVVADGVPVARARGSDLLFDLHAVVDRRRAGQLGTAGLRLDTDAYAAAVRADASEGVRHRYDIHPDPAPGGAPITVTVRSDAPLEAARLHWTADGTQPADPVTVEAAAVALAPVDGGLRFRAEIPGQPAGTLVRYRIAARAGGRWDAVADAAPAYTTPATGLLYVRPKRDGFSYAVGPAAPPDWVADAVLYHLLVDRFARHGGEAVAGPDQLDALAFAGGTLQGAVERLDHLAELGVNAVLLSPITSGEMHCAYDVKDLCDVDPRLGSLGDARHLCRAAHDRGMRVLLDLELSYLGGRHPAALRALLDPGSDERQWFHRSEDPPRLWGWMGANPMFRPVDHHHEPVRRLLLDSARFWLDVGFDGFRLDSAHAAPLDFWAELGQVVREHRPDAFTFGEVTAPRPERQALRGRLHGYADFDVEAGIRRFVAGDLSAGDEGGQVASALDDAARAAAGETALVPIAFADCHDDSRISLVAGGNERRIRTALVLLCTLPGPPLLLYGTEVGLDQERPGHVDLELRRRMPWEGHDLERLSWTRRLVRLRRDSVALRRGGYVSLAVDDGHRFIAYARTHPSGHLVVAANGGTTSVERPLSLPGGAMVRVRLEPGNACVLDGAGRSLLATD